VVKETRVKSFQDSLDLKSLKAKEEKMPTKTETTAMTLNGTRNLLNIRKQRTMQSQKRRQRQNQLKKMIKSHHLIQHQYKLSTKVIAIAPKTTNVKLERETVIPTTIAKLVLSVVKEATKMMVFQDSLDLKNIKERREFISMLTSMETTAMTLTFMKRLPNLIQNGLTIPLFK